jgi:hypothetical protein
MNGRANLLVAPLLSLAVAGAMPVRIQFESGASSASLQVQFPRGPGVSTLSYVLAGRAGQVLEVSLRVRLELRFGAAGSGALHVDESGDCGFGHNVTARGDYRRTSLCAAPEAPQ